MFSIKPHIFGSTYFVRDVYWFVTKLDLKSLKCVFLRYCSMQKGYWCFYPSCNRYLDVTFLEHAPFVLDSKAFNNGEDDNLLQYHVTYKTTQPPSSFLSVPLPVLSLVIHTFSQHRDPLGSCLASYSSLASDPHFGDLGLPIALCKGKHNYAYPIFSFVTYDRLSFSSSSFVASINYVYVPTSVSEALSHLGWC